MTIIYSDEDGIATKQSQAVYDARIGTLLFTTSLLSWLGFGATIWEGAYIQDNMFLAISLDKKSLLRFSKLLWPTLGFHSHARHWKNNPISIYDAGLRGSLLSLLIVSAQLLGHESEPVFTMAMASLQLFVAVMLSIVQVLYPRRPDLFTPEGKHVDSERSSSALTRYTMHWCSTALALAGKPVPIDGLPVLNYATRSRSQSLLLISSPEATLWNRIVAERYFGFVKQWTLMLVRSMVTFGSPYCVMRILKDLESKSGETHDGWMWLIGMGISSLCQTLINHHLIWIQWSEMGIPIRAQLIMAIFQKALRRKDSKEQRDSSSSKGSEKPEALNLISSDTASFSKFTAVNYIIPASFIRFTFAGLFLWRLLGWQSTLAGMMVTVLCVPIHTILIKRQRAAQKKLTAARDKKSKVLSEALHSLRQIKFSALETQWEEHIETFRHEEIKHLVYSFTTSNVRAVWGIAAPFMVATASICTYAYLQGIITPSIIFPMIAVLPHLQGTLGFVPVVFQDYFGARSNASRMDGYLRRPEQKRILNPSLSGDISFRDASITWPSDEAKGEASLKEPMTPSHRFSLNRINLQFPVGELSVISGKTGSGKSLLLSAVIGEAELLGGRIEAPSAAEGSPVAFVSQTPWLQNATVKENILFGSLFEKDRYEKVIKACALQYDLAALALGDETQIGSRGIKLSGGQRARLAFGRALYSKAQLLVLDDIFSALDSHVSRDIFNALTGELGKGRTRILATHHLSLCLPKTKYIVQLEENTIGYSGSTEMIEDTVEFAEVEARLEPNTNPLAPQTPKPDASKNNVKIKNAPAKTKKPNARADSKVYKSYFGAAGGVGYIVIFVLLLVFRQMVSANTTWLLGRINSVRPERLNRPEKALPSPTNADSGMNRYLYLYFASSLLGITLEAIFNVYTFSGSVCASKTLFREMTSKVIRMPILWIDTTPIGVLLRGFTVDIKTVDDSVFAEISSFADCVIKLMTVVGFGLYTSSYTSILTVVLLFWCAYISRGYIKARTTVKRADAVPTADILEHFTTSTAGISTIRAFGAGIRAVDQMHLHLDRLSTARRHFWIFNRWLGLQMSLMGIMFSTGTGAILLSARSIIDPSMVGFALTFSMGFSQAIFQAVNSFGILETYMDAAGSVIGYTKLEPEDQRGEEILEDWPLNGKVELKELQVAYSAHLPLVLKDVSYTVAAGEKLGIVGRTGAGKSSLTLALLRLLEPRSGSIYIDGIDISTIKLNSLRSRIAFIPQDPVLFFGTVRSNLDYFKQVSEDKLKEALRRVKLLANEGDNKSGLFTLESQVSAGGANISQGQRQLLCLARVLLKNPKVMILDEATSAVDNETDFMMQEVIRNEFNGTLIVVAHRLGTIALFDRVMVMSDGKVAEFGKPADLLNKNGMFYDLVQNSKDRDFLKETILR